MATDKKRLSEIADEPLLDATEAYTGEDVGQEVIPEDLPQITRFRGQYATYNALVNDTKDNIINPVPEVGDAFSIATDGGEDPRGIGITAGMMVVFNGTDWFQV